MAVTNLTGYTWVGNDTLGTLGVALDATFDINFICDNVNYTSFIFINTFDDLLDYETRYDGVKVYSHLVDLAWTDDKYKTIKFISGDDVINSSLINWLEENGTLTKESDNTIKLGELSIDDLKLGEEQVNVIYLGETLVWAKS